MPCSHPCVNFLRLTGKNIIMVEKTEKGKTFKTPLTRGPCALCTSIATRSGTHVAKEQASAALANLAFNPNNQAAIAAACGAHSVV